MNRPLFVGRFSLNNIPLNNGTMCAAVRQYENSRPIDLIKHLYYPHLNQESNRLGDKGIYHMVWCQDEKIGYDPMNEIRGVTGCGEGFVCPDNTRFVEGTGVYETSTHKGHLGMRTRTWVDWNQPVLGREISLCRIAPGETDACILTRAHFAPGSVVVKIGDDRIMVTVPGDEEAFFVIGWLNPSGQWLPFGESVPQNIAGCPGGAGLCGNELLLPVGVSPFSRSFSKAGTLIIAAGATESEAISNLDNAGRTDDGGLQENIDAWTRWLDSGSAMAPHSTTVGYLERTSRTVMKMALSADSLFGCFGYWNYQGAVWVRDSIWDMLIFHDLGYRETARKMLEALLRTVIFRDDGQPFFSYNIKTKKKDDFTFEYDAAPLLLTGVLDFVRHGGSGKILDCHPKAVEGCLRAILASIDDTGMVRQDAGIWETFDPALGAKYEHMAWTSGTAAYALQLASDSDWFSPKVREECRSASSSLVDAIRKSCVRDGALCRSLETDGWDASVLNFFTRFPIFEDDRQLMRKTVEAVHEYLWDPFLGGIWRHDCYLVDNGDAHPWAGCTIWLAECYLAMGDKAKAQRVFQWVVDHLTCCGLSAESYFAHDIPLVLAMPSYSQAGVAQMLHHHPDIISKPS